MEENSDVRFSESIEKLFENGTVILFTCAANAEFPLLSVSRNAKDILGFGASYFSKHKHGWSERIHPNDKEEVVRQFHRLVQQGGGAINEYRFKTAEGSYRWLRDEIQVLEDEGKDVIYGVSLDITERKRAERALKESKTEELKQEIALRKETEKQLQKRLNYEKAISKCSELLLQSNSSEALHKSLKVLREVTEADRLFLYRNEEINGELFAQPVMEVTAGRVGSVFGSLQSRYSYSDYPFWYEKLSGLEKVHAQVNDLPDPERSVLKKQQVKSVLIIPIAFEGKWTGYIGFADTCEQRVWDEKEISLLETASRIIAAFENRRTIEESLIEQRNYTNAILNSLPSIYLLMDEDLNFIQWNDNAEQYTGYSSGELKSKRAFDLIAPADHEKLKDAVKQVRNGEGEGTELQLLTKSGDTLPYFWRGYFIELANKTRFLCVGVDITQQKEAQQALKDEKRFTDGVITSLPGIFYTLDTEGNYVRWNENFEKELGYSAEEIQNMAPDDFYSKEEFKKVASGLEKAEEEGYEILEANITTKSGKQVPFLLTACRIEQDGNVYITGVGHNISEQIKARRELRKSEELFRNLFLNAPAGIVMVDSDNKVLDINQSFERIFGFEKDELRGNDIDELIVPEEERGDVPRMPLMEYAFESFHREAQRITKNGDYIDVFIAAIPVYIDGEPIAGFGMYIDITEEKKYEQEISDSLEEKQTMLKEIHHRVKNNLAIVSGLLQLQMYETEDPLIQDTLKESERRIQTMALIHEKLYNSQNLGKISCDTYIGELVETIRNTIGSDQEVEVVTEIEPIKLKIRQAVPFALLVNEAVTNSFKHAFDDRTDNKIIIRIGKQGDGKVQAILSDNGKGLPKNISPEISDSLGLSLIDNFAQQLEADWEMGSDDGTYVRLVFQVEQNGGTENT